MAVKRCAVSSRKAKGSRRPNTSSAMHMYVSPSSHSRWNRWLSCAYEMRLRTWSHKSPARKRGQLEVSGAALQVQLVAPHRVDAARHSLWREPGVASGCEFSGRRRAQSPSQQAKCCSGTESLPRWVYARTGLGVMAWVHGGIRGSAAGPGVLLRRNLAPGGGREK